MLVQYNLTPDEVDELDPQLVLELRARLVGLREYETRRRLRQEREQRLNLARQRMGD